MDDKHTWQNAMIELHTARAESTEKLMSPQALTPIFTMYTANQPSG